MKRNKGQARDFAAEEEWLVQLLKNKNIPILILDERWLEIFPEHLQNDEIRSMVTELTKLLKKQGGLADNIKGMKRYKTQLMQEIVENMETDETALGRLKRRKLDKNQKKILELKESMSTKELELAEMPYQIRELNARLLEESTRVCYGRFRVSQERIEELDEDIRSLKEQLRKKLLEKQDCEAKNELMYSYLHDLLGARVMERLDRNAILEDEEEE
ncbi:MAG: hypothetical protein IJY09_07625 [Lachnospiraceae bacterium]|nr:hypothetical protein [Lachnospiraceae bacterium]